MMVGNRALAVKFFVAVRPTRLVSFHDRATPEAPTMIALVVPGIVGLFGLVFGGALLFFAIRARNRLKLIEAAPLCKADQLITGLAKMRGKIVALDEEDLLTSPMTKTVCVFFRFLIQEERTRTVTSYQNGRNVTRTAALLAHPR